MSSTSSCLASKDSVYDTCIAVALHCSKPTIVRCVCAASVSAGTTALPEGTPPLFARV